MAGLARHLAAPALALGLLLLATLWVPVSLDLALAGRDYFEADLFREWGRRALMGTIAARLGLDAAGFVGLLVAAGAGWAMALVAALWREAAPGRGRLPAVAALSVPFVFNGIVYLGNALGGFVDAAAALAILGALYGLDRSAARPIALLGAALGVVLAVGIHEKSLFDAAILALWAAWAHGVRSGACLAGAAALALSVLVALEPASAETSRQYLGELSAAHYLTNLAALGTVLSLSLNLPGVLLGGGVLWPLYVGAALRFVRLGDAPRDRRLRGALALAMALLCLTPLATAYDTSRLVGLIWLPTLLVLRASGLVRAASEQPRLTRLLAALAAFQLLLPPLHVFAQRALPLNCYASRVLAAVAVPEGVEGPPEALSLRDIGGAVALRNAVLCKSARLVR